MFKDRAGRCHKDNGKFTKCRPGAKKAARVRKKAASVRKKTDGNAQKRPGSPWSGRSGKWWHISYSDEKALTFWRPISLEEAKKMLRSTTALRSHRTDFLFYHQGKTFGAFQKMRDGHWTDATPAQLRNIAKAIFGLP